MVCSAGSMRKVFPHGARGFFPLEQTSGRKRRVVVDYRRVNQRTVRAAYVLRRVDDIKAEVGGSIYTTLLDAVSGF